MRITSSERVTKPTEKLHSASLTSKSQLFRQPATLSSKFKAVEVERGLQPLMKMKVLQRRKMHTEESDRLNDLSTSMSAVT